MEQLDADIKRHIDKGHPSKTAKTAKTSKI